MINFLLYLISGVTLILICYVLLKRSKYLNLKIYLVWTFNIIIVTFLSFCTSLILKVSYSDYIFLILSCYIISIEFISLLKRSITLRILIKLNESKTQDILQVLNEMLSSVKLNKMVNIRLEELINSKLVSFQSGGLKLNKNGMFMAKILKLSFLFYGIKR